MSLISRVWGLECSWSWQRAEKLWRLGNAWSRLSQHPPRSGGSQHLHPWLPLVLRETFFLGRMLPATSPCRLQHKLNQILTERIKSGNMIANSVAEKI